MTVIENVMIVTGFVMIVTGVVTEIERDRIPMVIVTENVLIVTENGMIVTGVVTEIERDRIPIVTVTVLVTVRSFETIVFGTRVTVEPLCLRRFGDAGGVRCVFCTLVLGRMKVSHTMERLGLVCF
jgi:hypothetical protein